jgi:hydroxymethylpyrimidine pyrophosphatase-like HAD family hydrolase
MIDHAGVGVAVDVAPDEVRAAASMIIPGPAELGLLTAFTRLGLTA